MTGVERQEGYTRHPVKAARGEAAGRTIRNRFDI